MRVFGCNFVRFFTVNPIMAAKSAAFRSKNALFFLPKTIPQHALSAFWEIIIYRKKQCFWLQNLLRFAQKTIHKKGIFFYLV
jgi:hypothetical protein